ncbi:hypothetical protein [Streptosporangium roseum]|uniref:SbtR family transcriptional regulator n=1 Tax=Streptosporangium roseum TaxID=2001 RepID=UPI00332F5420
MQVTDRGFATVFMTQFPDALDYDHKQAWAEEGLARLVQRAREAGQLRVDFDPADITLLLMANSSLAGQPPDTALAASRRLLAYLFEAFQAAGPGPLPPPAAIGLRQLRDPADRP